MHDEAERFLDFEFEQVLAGGAVEYLLVSVSDITDKVVLRRELAGAEARVKGEVEALLAILDQDPLTVSTFLDATQERLLGVNAALQDVPPSPIAYSLLINQIARVAHGIKGESGALGLLSLEDATHQFEEVLAPLRSKRDISGDALIPVAVAMNEILEEVAKIKRVVGRLLQFATQTPPAADTPSFAQILRQTEQLTLRVAEDLNKKVRFETRLQTEELPAPLLRALREALPQLVRNAVAHGIEPVTTRLDAGKPEAGTIRLTLDVNEAGQLVVSVEDDGGGIDPVALRQRVIEKGMKTPQEVAGMSDEEIAALMFAPGFSVLEEAGTHAGRGDGLAVVKEIAERFGARLQISSRPAKYTRFSLLFGDNRWLFA
jgi:chemotaxis protein histidine kinase CheA